MNRRGFLGRLAAVIVVPHFLPGLPVACGVASPSMLPAPLLSGVVARKLYRSNGRGRFRLIATLPANATHWVDATPGERAS